MRFVKPTLNRETRTARWGEVVYWRGRTPGGLPRRFGDKRVGWLHAEKGGAPVLRGEDSWHTICGVYANVFGGFFTLQVRRFWR